MLKFLKNAFVAGMTALVIGSGAAGAVTFNLETNGGSGTGSSVAGGPNQFNLTLVSNDSSQDLSTAWTGVADQNYSVSFDWTYFTTDDDGSSFDVFGYFVGNVLTQLSSLSQPTFFNENGTAGFLVSAGQTFGFYISNFVGGEGPAFATVRGNLVAAVVPIPAAGFLLLGSLAGLALVRTRRRSFV